MFGQSASSSVALLTPCYTGFLQCRSPLSAPLIGPHMLKHAKEQKAIKNIGLKHRRNNLTFVCDYNFMIRKTDAAPQEPDVGVRPCTSFSGSKEEVGPQPMVQWERTNCRCQQRVLQCHYWSLWPWQPWGGLVCFAGFRKGYGPDVKRMEKNVKNIPTTNNQQTTNNVS